MAPAFRHSLRWQIQLYYTALMVLIMAILAVGFYHYEKRLKIESLDHELAATMLPLLPRLFTNVMGFPSNGPGPGRDPLRPGPPGSGDRSRPPPRRETPAPIADIPTLREKLAQDEFYVEATARIYAVMFDVSGTLLFSSANAPDSPEFIAYPRGERYTVNRWSDGRREVVHPGPAGLQVILGLSGETLEKELRQLAATLTLIALGSSLLFSIIGWRLIDRGLRPIREIGDTARKISRGDLQERIPTQHIQNELGPLANLLNDTFARLDESLQSQRRFNADASHELRTPLAIIITDCDFSLLRERPNERYLKTIRTCREAAQHMAVLVEDLNLIAKADAAALRLRKEPGDLVSFLHDIAQLTTPLAQAKNIEVVTELALATAELDFNLMRQVCVNLIGNAVTYNRPKGKVILRTGRAGEFAFIEIEDTGVGIAPADLSHIFERFYRADKARGHVAGQTGLGLAITRTIVEAHGGTITARSKLGTGSCFRIELPGGS